MRLGAPGELWLVEAEDMVGEVDTQLHLLHLGVEGRPQKNPSRNALMLSVEAFVLLRPGWPVEVREISNGKQLQFCTPKLFLPLLWRSQGTKMGQVWKEPFHTVLLESQALT